MSKVNEVLKHITTDLTYVSQDDLNADEGIKYCSIPVTLCTVLTLSLFYAFLYLMW